MSRRNRSDQTLRFIHGVDRRNDALDDYSSNVSTVLVWIIHCNSLQVSSKTFRRGVIENYAKLHFIAKQAEACRYTKEHRRTHFSDLCVAESPEQLNQVFRHYIRARSVSTAFNNGRKRKKQPRKQSSARVSPP